MNNETIGFIVVLVIVIFIIGEFYKYVILPILRDQQEWKTFWGKHKGIVVYGGAFDPITRAHVSIAKKINRVTNMPVWIMPCFGHVFGKDMASSKDRLEMVSLSIKEFVSITACGYEINTQHTGSMYDTLKNLSKSYPNTTFYLAMGMDNANNIHKWINWEKLITEFPCVVFKRQGIEPIVQWFLQAPHQFVEIDIDISSTTVRNAIKAQRNQEAKWLVPSAAWKYIKSKGLYEYKEIT